MKHLYMVYPEPPRFFPDMLEVCVQLDQYYKQAPASPLYVITMKRSYFFESSCGAYIELERGDRLLIFQSTDAPIQLSQLFNGCFPSPELLKETQWEGIEFLIGIMAIDDKLNQTLADMRISLHPYNDNQWMLIEDYASYIARFHANQEDSM